MLELPPPHLTNCILFRFSLNFDPFHLLKLVGVRPTRLLQLSSGEDFLVPASIVFGADRVPDLQANIDGEEKNVGDSIEANDCDESESAEASRLGVENEITEAHH